MNLKKVLESTEDQIKCTVIHEIFHWFQSYYDPRSNLAKSKKSLSGEETILYEAGAVWAEQFMNSGKLNGEFVKDYLPLYTISVKDLDAVFSFEKDASVTKSSQEKYKRHGYGLWRASPDSSSHLRPGNWQNPSRQRTWKVLPSPQRPWPV